MIALDLGIEQGKSYHRDAYMEVEVAVEIKPGEAEVIKRLESEVLPFYGGKGC